MALLSLLVLLRRPKGMFLRVAAGFENFDKGVLAMRRLGGSRHVNGFDSVLVRKIFTLGSGVLFGIKRICNV